MKLDELEMQEAKLSDEDKKLRAEMVSLGLSSKMYEVRNGLLTTFPGYSVKYKSEMAHNEDFVKNGKLVHQWDMVGEDFIIRNLGLTTLEGCPEHVSGDFDCSVNNITSFSGSPKFIGRDYLITQNPITDLTDLKEYVEEIRGEIYFNEKKIKKGALSLLQIQKLKGISDSLPQFKILAKYIGKPNEIFDCQQELIESGYEELAE